jgi:cysteine synthase
MWRLGPPKEYGIGTTAMKVVPVEGGGVVHVKLENSNMTGSIKDRTAYFLLWGLMRSGRLRPGETVVESTSGNLGTSLARFGRILGFEVLCVVDDGVPAAKIDNLRQAGARVEVVSQGDFPDARSARIARVGVLGQLPGHVWPNQYDNPMGVLAHSATTAPEIWRELKRAPDVVVAPVGTGGTVCGVGRYAQVRHSGTRIIAVEPLGSTIFGGEAKPYLGVGAGLREPSSLLRRFGCVIDSFAKIPDSAAIASAVHWGECGLKLGITAGGAVSVAAQLVSQSPDWTVVAVAPDDSGSYAEHLSGGGHPWPIEAVDIKDAAAWRQMFCLPGRSPRQQ